MIVLADGTFDPLHVGHLRYLRAAKSFGTLVVRVAPDDAIIAKGRQPFQTQSERAELIAALDGVDRVVLSDTLEEALDSEPFGALVKGIDWIGRLEWSVESICEWRSIKILFVDTNARRSTERLKA